MAQGVWQPGFYQPGSWRQAAMKKSQIVAVASINKRDAGANELESNTFPIGIQPAQAKFTTNLYSTPVGGISIFQFEAAVFRIIDRHQPSRMHPFQFCTRCVQNLFQSTFHRFFRNGVTETELVNRLNFAYRSMAPGSSLPVCWSAGVVDSACVFLDSHSHQRRRALL